MKKRQQAIEALMERPNATKIEYGSITIIRYERVQDGKSTLAIFKGKKADPAIHLYYEDPTLAEEAINEEFTREEIKRAERLMQEGYYESLRDQLVPGIIMCSIWGVELNNVEFYKIVDRNNDHITLVEIDCIRSGTNVNGTIRDDHGYCIPNPTISVGVQFNRKISRFAEVNITKRISAHKWDNSPIFWSSF
jgi:hypothetical protein